MPEGLHSHPVLERLDVLLEELEGVGGQQLPAKPVALPTWSQMSRS